MILKVEMLLDANDAMGKFTPQAIATLLDAVFQDNSHLAKIIICEVTENEGSVPIGETRDQNRR